MIQPLPDGTIPLDEVVASLPAVARSLAAQSSNVFASLIRFGGDVKVLSKFTRKPFDVKQINASSGSPLGAAFSAALDEIEAAKRFIKDNGGSKVTIPVIVAFTDGSPTDNWRPVAVRVRNLIKEKKLVVYIGAIGHHQFLNQANLEEFVEDPACIFPLEYSSVDLFIKVVSDQVTISSQGQVKAAQVEIRKMIGLPSPEKSGANDGTDANQQKWRELDTDVKPPADVVLDEEMFF